MDHKVNEAPWVIRYRDCYYMLYNSNHTSLAYGNYGIGCAVADTPLGFNNEGKYPYPVLRDNWDRIHDNAQVLSPLSRETGVLWQYLEETPVDDWATAEYDDNSWKTGEGAFGNKSKPIYGGVMRSNWECETIWMRREFLLEDIPISGELRLFINYYGNAAVYINGVPACNVSGLSGGYTLQPVSAEAIAALRSGANVLAVQCTRHKPGIQYIDAGLYSFEKGKAEPVVQNCGQPNLVRGPNGFEWWLVYFAVYDGNPKRAQAIDRVFFFDRELVMLPPTTDMTPGTWRLPASATAKDSFASTLSSEHWRITSGQWHTDKDLLIQESVTENSFILMNQPPRNHYLFETSVLLDDVGKGSVGVVAWENAEEQRLLAGIDYEANAWYWQIENQQGKKKEIHPLPDNFNWNGWRMVQVRKNHDTFSLFIDDIPAPGEHIIIIPDVGEGCPGLFTNNARGTYGSVVDTIGWDEYGDNISGWGNSVDGTHSSGKWTTDKQGLSVTAGDEEAHVFKGDLLDNYEWSVQVKPIDPTPASTFGIYALYCDTDNYLRLSLNNAMNEIKIISSEGDKEYEPLTFPVRLRKHRLTSVEKSGLNLRIVRTGGRVAVYADGYEVVDFSDVWSAAQVGLFAEKTGCCFNGTTHFDRSDNH